MNSPSPIPDWINATNAPYLIATAFLREFSEDNNFDIDVISKLLNKNWESIREQLYYLSKLKNSCISKIGNFWKNNNPEIIINYCLGFIDEGMIKKFCDILAQKLSKIDDKYNKSPEDRYFYFSIQQNRDISENLKNSFAKTLALLAALNEKGLINPQANVQYKIDFAVKKIFINSKDWRLWATLENNIPFLAEASPKEFLETISSTISNRTTFKEIFEQSSEISIFTQCIQAPILFGLEILAWNKTYLPIVCKLLLNMHLQDEGKSKFENRPLNSLTDILTPWNLQTTASVEDIEEILNSILEQFDIDDIKFDFLVRLLDKHSGSLTSKPKYRKWNIPNEIKTTNRDFYKFINFLFDNVFDMLGNNGKYWAKIFNIALNSNIEIRNKFILKINKKDFSEFNDSDLLMIKDCIADIFHYVKIKKDLDNEEAYDKNIMNVLNDIFNNRIKIKNKNFEYLYLYSKKNGYNHEIENNNRLEERLALQDIIKKEKITGLIKFICLTELKHFVALDLANIDLTKEEINKIIKGFLKDKTNTDFDKGLEFVSSFVSCLYYYKGFSCLNDINIQKLTKKEILLLIKDIRVDKNILEWTKDKKIDKEYLEQADSNIFVEKKENFDFVLKELLDRKLYFKAFNLISLNINKFIVSENLILQILKNLDLNEITQKREDVSLFSYHLKQLFEILYKSTSIRKEDLVPIEFKFFYSLKRDFNFPKFIKYEFFNNGQFFIDLIKIFLLSKEKQHVDVVYDILKIFIEYDLDDKKAEDNEFLSNIYNWVENILNLVNKKDLKVISMIKEMIGERLARTPIDPEDNIFPHKEIRKILEKFNFEELRRGFLIELFNKRGINFRERHSGGKLEKELAQEYNEFANKLQNKYPTTASVLREMASRYEFDANELDKIEELED